MNDYTDNQVESVLHEIGVDVITSTDTDLLCLCPYHRNTDTPAMSINKYNGAWMCFAPHCGETGKLVRLVQDKTTANVFVAKRLIEKYRGAEPTVTQYLDDILKPQDVLPTFNQDIINRLADDIWQSPGQEYMHGRGFEDKTLAYFSIGYSKSNNMVTIPVHDSEANAVGMVARSITDKRFKNTKNLPTKRIPFNVHRAKKHAGPVIIVESSMDAMMVHQAGHPCVIATNGSIFSEYHVKTINRYWNEIIIMTDFDDYNDHRDLRCKKCENTCMGHNPGRALGEKMVKSMLGRSIKWAAYDYGIVYPHGAKDAGELSMEEINKCINNAVTDLEYVLWKTEFPLLNVI